MWKKLLPFLTAWHAAATAIEVTNPSFEVDSGGWDDGWVTSSGKTAPSIAIDRREDWTPEYAKCSLSQRNAPPDGAQYASVDAGATAITQTLSAEIEAGKTYTLTVYARGLNTPWGGVSSGQAAVTARPEATMRFMADGEALSASTSKDVGSPVMKGYARADNTCAQCHTDDGANIWFDGDYRMHAGGPLFYSLKSEDPVTADWKLGGQILADGMALAPAVTDQGLKAIIATWYKETQPVWSKLSIHHLGGTAPEGVTTDGLTGDDQPTADSILLQNLRDSEDPWVMDAQTFYDTEEKRLWMVWGGHETYISELDPKTGKVCCADTCATLCTDKDFDDTVSHHTRLLTWDRIGAQKAGVDNFRGDGCAQAYQEGPALYKYQGNFYVFSSYGSMGEDYTIRVCRSTSGARGPYYDKSGRDCTQYEASSTDGGQPGSSMLLGPEDEQSVPGHPHIWEENGKYYLGYDFRKGPAMLEDRVTEGTDYMAIRELFWVEDATGAPGWWPTIWTPLVLTVNADDVPDAIGKTLGLELSNTGETGSIVGFDMVSVTAAATPSTPPPATPPPATPPPATPPPATPPSAPEGGEGNGEDNGEGNGEDNGENGGGDGGESGGENGEDNAGEDSGENDGEDVGENTEEDSGDPQNTAAPANLSSSACAHSYGLLAAGLFAMYAL